MKHFKDTTNDQPHEFDENVIVIKQLDTSYRFETQETVHVEDLKVRRPAVVIHHDQVLEAGGVKVATPAYDEIVTEAFDDLLVAAHDEVRTVLVLNAPTTLVPISQSDFEALQAAHLAENQAYIDSLPKLQAFIDAIKVAVGGIVAANSLATAYPLFFAAIQAQNWPDVEALILDARSKNIITADQYSAIKSAATTNNLPLTLP